jgi:hypothetical protein
VKSMKTSVSILAPIVLSLLGGIASGCGPTTASANAAPSGMRYELTCDSSDTRQTSALFCVRLDSSTGDVKRVDLTKLKYTTGSTMGPEKGLGVYQLVCDSTSTDIRSEFHCVRLDRSTGEVVMIGLPKVETIAN